MKSGVVGSWSEAFQFVAGKWWFGDGILDGSYTVPGNISRCRSREG